MLSNGDREGIELSYEMTQADADEMNRQDGPYDDPEEIASGYHGCYSAGDMSTRFLSKESLPEAALACWQTHFPKASVLIEGEPCVIEPQPILVGQRIVCRLSICAKPNATGLLSTASSTAKTTDARLVTNPGRFGTLIWRP